MQNSVPARDWCRNLNAPSKHLTRERLSGIILLLAPNKCTNQEPWCSGLTCLPVTQKIAGSNPVGSAPRHSLWNADKSSQRSISLMPEHTLRAAPASERQKLLRPQTSASSPVPISGSCHSKSYPSTTSSSCSYIAESV